MSNIIPFKGASWKHLMLERIASTKDFPTRLRLFHILKKFFGLDFLKRSTPSKVKLFLNIKDYVQYQIYFYGNYEIQSVKLFKKLSLEAKVIFDVGAHIGQYSLEAAVDDLNYTKKIFAIEANPYTFSFLINNIRINNFKQIIPILGAVGNDNSIVRMAIPSYSNLGNTQIADVDKSLGVENYYISSLAIENILSSFNIKEIDLMKIDIEGHEYMFFEKLFKNGIFPKKIIFEYIPDVFVNCNLLVTLFKMQGYEIFNSNEEIYLTGQIALEQNLLAIRN